MSARETITFFHRHDPALTVGTYQLTVKHDLTSPPKGKQGLVVDEHPTSTTTFAVGGPRFVLGSTAIAGQFPAPNTEGDYGSALAHVAFDRLTLPWERATDPSSADTSDTDPPTSMPWLALLVFGEDEGVVAVDAQVGDLQRQPFAPDPTQPAKTRASTLIAAGAYSYADADTGWRLEPGQSPADRCRVIDVPVALFAAVAPATDDLQWLAHVRASGGSPLAYVTANRTPAPAARSTAHLVSLEHLAAFLPTAAGTPAAALAGATSVRLVTLASWTFRTQAQTFAQRLGSVHCDVLSLPDSSPAKGDAADMVGRALRAGYCGLAHRTRAGDVTIAWYRGPLVPFGVPDGIVPAPDPDNPDPVEPISTADALLRYDPQTAMFDISYAAAWQLGRLLAVADDQFSGRLRAWKATVNERTALTLEREMIAERIGSALALDPHALPPAGALKAAAAILPSRVGAALDSRAARDDAPTAPPPGPGLHERISDALAAPQSLLAADGEAVALPEPLANWFGRLGRLRGVPLAYLVPDEGMLPSPSLRFFRIDPNWMRALLEGAFSIARSCTSHAAHDAAVAPLVHAAATPPSSGLLLRSPIVDDLPDLLVTASDAGGKSLGVRFERIAPGIAMCLFDGSAATVEIHEAPSGMHFDLTGLKPRYVTVQPKADAAPGDEIGGAKPVDVAWRVGRTVSFAALAQRFAAAVGVADFTSAELAIQLAAKAEAVGYRIEAA